MPGNSGLAISRYERKPARICRLEKPPQNLTKAPIFNNELHSEDEMGLSVFAQAPFPAFLSRFSPDKRQKGPRRTELPDDEPNPNVSNAGSFKKKKKRSHGVIVLRAGSSFRGCRYIRKRSCIYSGCLAVKCFRSLKHARTHTHTHTHTDLREP